MPKSVPRHWNKLTFLDPLVVLRRYREIAESGLLDGLSYEVSSMRRKDVRPHLATRQAALFCYGVGHALGVQVGFAMLEDADFDFIARYQTESTDHYVPVQLKELVPAHLPSKDTLQGLLDKLLKYTDSKDLVVVIHMNRDIVGLRTADLTLPRNIRQLWLYGAKDPTQRDWHLIGDMLEDPTLVREFRYPSSKSLYWVELYRGPYSEPYWYWSSYGPDRNR